MPYWRLSAVYFCYFAVVGVMSPYWGLYLEALDFRPSEIGLLSAIPMVTKLAAPNIWGALADASGRRLAIIRFGALGACLCFMGIFFSQQYLWLIAVTVSFSFFWNAILAQFEVVTLSHLGDQAHQYSRIRVWGSVGFIVTVVILGWVFEMISVRYLPVVLFLFLVGILISALALPAESTRTRSGESTGFLRQLLRPRIIWFFTVFTFLQIGHGVYYTFYSIYLESFDYSRTAIGLLWALGVLAEIYIFMKMPALFQRYSLAGMLQLSLLLTAVRWFLTGWFPEYPLIVTLVQLIHALSFGVTHAVAIEYVRLAFGRRAQGQGQAFYSAICFGGGNAVGAYVSGLLWEPNPLWAFGFAVAVTLVALVMAMVFLPAKHFSRD